MSEDTELSASQVRMRKDGTLYVREDGKESEIAKYDRNSGHVEFVTKEFSVKYYNQVTAKIGTVQKGTQVSGFTIKSIGVAGEDRPSLKNVPKRPKMGPLGDAGEDVVRWYLDHNLSEAIIRYGIFVDEKGNPIRKAVRRVIENTIDMRDMEDDGLEWIKDGRKSQTRAPVMRVPDLFESKSEIVARRATALTFTPQEVVGGFDVDDVESTSEEDES